MKKNKIIDFKNNLKSVTMNKKNATVEKAQDIFQRLPVEKQNHIKNNEIEVYQTIFSKEPLVDGSILDDFINRYQQEIGLRDRALNVFQKMSAGKQFQVKSDDSKLYNALFDPASDNSLLEEFLDKYEPLNEKVTNFKQFNELTLEDQLNFKNQFPDDYSKIISTEPS
ncbi:hypothetical protein [Chryseobacterium binzhouense]|uniref:hypothetical protein n=1 Tax=Chryseobacterium binzhouense TaxID=2593646 RepID=UPI00289FC60D|nr:hypothetical protein [Chryseobacterium binzhouense]